ncbi:hypothetical protein [Parapedobacter tibetensis]|nr:hypothetical protein [Parapedobacter tibetensis]
MANDSLSRFNNSPNFIDDSPNLVWLGDRNGGILAFRGLKDV